MCQTLTNPHLSHVTFMVTDYSASQVDYRRPWTTLSKSGTGIKSAQLALQMEDITSNRFGALSVDIGEQENDSMVHFKLCDSDFPIPLASNDFTRRQRMPKLPPRKTQLARRGCVKPCCDAEEMSNHEFNNVIRVFGNDGDDCW